VAVLAFKGVVALELKRRDNERKVVALKMEMSGIMKAHPTPSIMTTDLGVKT
jgi:hypothetical protein